MGIIEEKNELEEDIAIKPILDAERDDSLSDEYKNFKEMDFEKDNFPYHEEDMNVQLPRDYEKKVLENDKNMLIIDKSLDISNQIKQNETQIKLFPKEDDRISTMSVRYGYPNRFKELMEAGQTGTAIRDGVRVAQYRDKELRNKVNMF